MILYLALLAATIFAILSWKKFSLAVGIFIIALPTYLLRFNFGPLPSTLLEVLFGTLLLVWLIKYSRHDYTIIKQFFTTHHLFCIFYLIFFVSSVTSIFVSDMWFYSLGQWRAYFLEPMLLFIILIGRQETLLYKKYILFFGLSTFSVSLFAIFQKYTGLFLPTAEWQSEATRRVTSFFTSPNAVGLYLAPLLPLLFVPLIKHASKTCHLIEKIKNILRNPALWITLPLLIALFFTKSLGSWIALAVGSMVFLFLIGYKKTAAFIVVSCILLSLFVSPVRTFILSKDRSSGNRVELWTYSAEFLSASPKNFFLGTGIRQFFRKVQKPHYDVKEMERLIYPHNIFLNFWTEISLFGLVGFVGVFYSLLAAARKTLTSNRLLGAAFITTLVIFFTHGLIDVPYFKNDLAFLFWALAAMVLTAKPEN